MSFAKALFSQHGRGHAITETPCLHVSPARHETTDRLWTLRHTRQLHRHTAALHEGGSPPHVRGEMSTTGRFYGTLSNAFVRASPGFLSQLKNGQPDRSYFTPDCFHLSQKAHTLMARALWNNMVGSSRRSPILHSRFSP